MSAMSAVVFLVVGYVLLLVLTGCFTSRAKKRNAAERERDRKDGGR